jgi:excisionase family DNA binding protein
MRNIEDRLMKKKNVAAEHETWTADEIALKLRVHVQTVHAMVHRGDLRGVYIGHVLRVGKTTFTKFLEGRQE